MKLVREEGLTILILTEDTDIIRRADIVGAACYTADGRVFLEDSPERLLEKYQSPKLQNECRWLSLVTGDSNDDCTVEEDSVESELDEDASDSKVGRTPSSGTRL